MLSSKKQCIVSRGKEIDIARVTKSRRRRFQFDAIDLDLDGGGLNCFTLGNNFNNTKITVKVVSSQQGNTTIEEFSTRTDGMGQFKVNIPANSASPINLTVKIRMKKRNKLNCVNQCAASAICCGVVLYEEEDCLVVEKDFSQYTDDLVWRTYNGSENNLTNPNWGMRNDVLIRLTPAAFEDDVSSLAVRGDSNPSPRMVSNAICKDTGSKLNSLRITDMAWIWGQFLDHELDLTPSHSEEAANIITPTLADDPNEDFPEHTILFNRSGFVKNCLPRKYPNKLSSFIDGTNVYGYSTERAFALRRLDGSGKLATNLADNSEIIMPYNTQELENESLTGMSISSLFLAGDVRANENIFLSAMHTLFVREHNRLCDQIVNDFPQFAGQDEMIFQHVRRHVYGIMQSITYQEFLPALLGSNTPDAWTHYDSSVHPGISIEFSTAFYRLGHSMLSSNLKVGTDGNINLMDAFFKPEYIQEFGIDKLLQGAFLQRMQEIDGEIVDDVRNNLFGPPTSGHLLDLATLNIQRGRDHGLPDYNTCREAYALARKNSFAEVTSDASVQVKLASVYDTVDDIDPWIGALVEDHVPGAAVGELICEALKEQFERLQISDRFWFENDAALSEQEKESIRNTTLADVIRRNTSLSNGDVPDDVFHLPI